MNNINQITFHQKLEREKQKFLIIMKLSAVFLFIATLQIMATGYAQTVSLNLNMDNTSIRDVFREIERQTELSFIFSDDISSLNKEVSVNVRKKNIKDVLNQLFTDTDLGYQILNEKLIVIAPKTILQQITITGRVTDDKGEPLPGASVIVKGTSQGTVTDVNGAYSLQVSDENATLVFSFVGFTPQEITVGGQRSINITMTEDSQQIEEVVVVGYGTQRKETLTGAVATISSAELTTSKTDNLMSNMQGKMPGLLIRQQTGEPGDFSNLVSIRGYGSPVVVIDGLVRSRNGLQDLAQLNAEDIESISILKDASAAIYGMNAANGVIIVTTKRGVEQKPRFTYSGMFGIKMPTGMPKMVDAYTYRLMQNEYNRNIGAPPTYSDEILAKYKAGDDPMYGDYDWLDMYIRKAVPVHNHTISVRGGNEKVSYFSSLGYSEDNGLVKSDVYYYKRYTFRNNLTVDLADDLKMNVNLSGRYDKRSQGYEDFIWTYKSLIVDDRGIPPYTLDEFKHFTIIGPEDKNPAALIDPNADGYRKNNNFSATTAIDFTYTPSFVKGLSLNLLGSFDYQTRNSSLLQGKYPLYSYNNNTQVFEYVKDFGARRYWNQMYLYGKTYVKFQVNYTFKVDAHSIALLGAAEASQERYDMLRGERPYNDAFTFDILDMASSSGQTNEGNREFRRYAALIGRVNYDYAGKYLLEGMLRRDGSYRYAPSKRWVVFPSVSAAWRVSEEDFFKNNVTFINSLKLRTSWGVSGRDQGNPYAYLPAFTANNQRGYLFEENNLTVGMYPPGIVFNNMTWVTAKLFNVGVDAGFLKNKLSATFEFFRRDNTGILANRQSSVTNTFGASFPQENINSDMNIGLELQVRYRDRVGDFRYTVGANATYARTKRLHVEDTKPTSQWDNWINKNENRYQGRSRLYTYSGQFTSRNEMKEYPLLNGGALGNYRIMPGAYRLDDNNGDGIIDGDDQLFVNWAYGDQGYVSAESNTANQRVNPPLQYGFTFEASYKNFDLNLLLQGAALYSVNYHMNDIWGYGRYPTLHERFTDRWYLPQNADGSYPDSFDPNAVWTPGKFPAGRPYNYDNTADANATKMWRPMATYLRIKNIELGYTIPKSVLNRIGIDNVRFYLNASNLYTFCNKEIRLVDPERHENDWNAGLSYPIMKAVNFGINLTF